jgi:cathepsin X
MISDRIRHALHGRGVPDVTLSRQDVLDCAGSVGYGENEGGGGEGVDVMEYMRQYGIPDETCNIYQGVPKKCDMDQRCTNCLMAGRDRNASCFPVKKFVKYKVKDYGYVSY